MSDAPKLYSAAVCPFAQRTRMVLHEKGVEAEEVEVDLQDKPPWFLEVSPYGKVPVLVRGRDHVYESAVINEYLDEVYHEPCLLPELPGPRAQARIWIKYCDDTLVPAIYKLLLEQDPDAREEKREALLESLRFLEREGLARLPATGPYWHGDHPGMVDLTYYPFFERFCVLEHYRGVDWPEECSRLRH